jgi:hypothetical protein
MDMMAAPFLAFLISFCLARWSRPVAAIGMFFVALALSLAMFLVHADQTLPIKL